MNQVEGDRNFECWEKGLKIKLKKFTIPHLVLEVVQKQSLWRDEGHGIYNSVRRVM